MELWRTYSHHPSTTNWRRVEYWWGFGPPHIHNIPASGSMVDVQPSSFHYKSMFPLTGKGWPYGGNLIRPGTINPLYSQHWKNGGYSHHCPANPLWVAYKHAIFPPFIRNIPVGRHKTAITTMVGFWRKSCLICRSKLHNLFQSSFWKHGGNTNIPAI